MFKKDKYFSLVLISNFIVLLPIIFFPIHSDISIFALTGKIIAEGGKIYADYLDLKPPLFLYIWAIIYKIFGISEISLRVFDFIAQFTTAILIYKFVINKFPNERYALYSSIIYSISYSALNYSQTMQPESFAGILIITVLFLIDNKKFVLAYILIGLITGLLASLKFTFLLIGFPILIFDLFIKTNELKTLIIKYIALFSGFIIVIALNVLILSNSEIYENFSYVLGFLSFYSSIPPIDQEFIKNSLKMVGKYFGDNYSLSFFISFVFAFKLLKDRANNHNNSSKTSLLLIITIILTLFISVVIERKFAVYHLSRFYAPISILAGIGITIIMNNLKEFMQTNRTNYIFGIIAFTFIIIFSPLPRVISNYIPSIYYFINTEKYDKFYQRDDAQNIRKTYIRVADKINNEIQDNSLALVIAIGGNQINYYLKTAKHSKFSHSLFYFGNYNIEKWQKEFSSELKKAKIIAIQTNDIHPILTGHNKSSLELLLESGYFSYFNENFEFIEDIDCYKIYKRK